MTFFGTGKPLPPIPPEPQQFIYHEPLGPIATEILKILFARAAELWPMPEDPFDITPWLELLTQEQRDALQALSSG